MTPCWEMHDEKNSGFRSTRAAVAAYSQRAAILTVVMARGLDARMNENILSSLDDGLHVALCGAGGPMPAPHASGPCVAVVAGDQLPLCAQAMRRSKFESNGVSSRRCGCCIYYSLSLRSHRYAGGDGDAVMGCGIESHRRLPMVKSSNGVETVVDGFNKAYSHDFVYRHEHHGDLVATVLVSRHDGVCLSASHGCEFDPCF